MLTVQRVLQSGRFVLGEEGKAFEVEWAAHVGGGVVTGVASGTDAIELLLRALEIGPDDAVVLPARAPSAVAAAVRRAGVRIVLCDVQEETLTLCPKALRERLKVSPSIKAVLHQQPAFASGQTFPVAEKAVNEVLSLPMHPYLCDAAIEAECGVMEGFQA